jgi:heterodisulfide reductase subunit B
MVTDNSQLLKEVEEVLEMPIAEYPRTIHPLEMLTSNDLEDKIQQSLQHDLSDLKVVCYYGCHISRPAEVMQFDDPEYPVSMDHLLNWVGVQTLDWSGKVECCGAHFSMIKTDLAIDMCAKLFRQALDVNADAIVVACPMCHANLDIRQAAIAKKMGESFSMPILYFSQVLGYAFGIEPKTLGMKKHIVDPMPLMLDKCQSIPSQ